MDDGPYRGDDEDYWWYDVKREENAKYIQQFLMALAVNPVWSNSLFHKDTQTKCVGFCPFHKIFLPYYSHMNVNTFLTDYKIGSCGGNKPGRFDDHEALRQHLSCHGDWWHKLVTWFTKAMFNQTPGVYEDDSSKLVPKKDCTE